MKNVIIISRAAGKDGPSRGAICIANAISDYAKVKFLCLSNNLDSKDDLNKKIEFVKYDTVLRFFRLIYDLNYGRFSKKTHFKSIISMTILADCISVFLVKNSFKKFISIRGDLSKNYKDSYGKIGLFIAKFHYLISQKADKIVCMSNYMDWHVRNVLPKSKRVIIENFIDETKYNKKLLKKNKSKIANNKFIFVGTLSNRKQIIPLIEIFKSLVEEGNEIYLEIIGDGVLKNRILEYIRKNKLKKNIIYRGEVKEPELFFSNSSIFVMPSLSEGISRAVLEALHFRLPVILRKIPQNQELIFKNQNGWLFENNIDLKEIIKSIIEMNPKHKIFNSKKSLIPRKFQYDIVKQKWKCFLEL